LSVDSDDQNFINKADDADGNRLVAGDGMKYTYCEGLLKNQCNVDNNGNSDATDNLNSNYYTDSMRGTIDGKDDDDNGNVNSKKQIDPKAITRLQAMAMSDDDDYGKLSSCPLLYLSIHLIQ
jgi:hypothetical protein